MFRWARKLSVPTISNYISTVSQIDKGSGLIQFAVSRNVIIGSTFHPHKDIRKITWSSPDGVTLNQIDHF
jgi:hypothetical protein